MRILLLALLITSCSSIKLTSEYKEGKRNLLKAHRLIESMPNGYTEENIENGLRIVGYYNYKYGDKITNEMVYINGLRSFKKELP